MKLILKYASCVFVKSTVHEYWRIMTILCISVLLSINTLTICYIWREIFGESGLTNLLLLLSGNYLAFKMFIYLFLPYLILIIFLFYLNRKSLIKSELKKMSTIPFVVYYFISWFLYVGTVLVLI